MERKSFSSHEAVSFGWDTFKQNVSFFIGLLIIMAIITFVPDYISKQTKETMPLISLVVSVAAVCLRIFVGMGMIKIALKFCDNERGEFADLFSCSQFFLAYLAGSILYGLIMFGGLLLLIVPGVIWEIKFQYFKYLIIDNGMDPIEALKASAKITDGTKGDLFIFGLLLTAINILGAFALILGLFVTIPLTMLADAFVFRALAKQEGFFAVAPTAEGKTKEGVQPINPQ